MGHFTPWASLLGGVLLGLASSLLFAANGRVCGISGIVGDLLQAPSIRWTSNLLFVCGLLVGPIAFYALFRSWPLVRIQGSMPLLAIAGLLLAVTLGLVAIFRRVLSFGRIA